MRVTPRLALLVLALTAFSIAGCSAARPLHRSAASIRASLLKRTPPGMTKQQVETFITREGWHIDSGDSAGLLPSAVQQGGGPPVPAGVHDALSAYLGGYFIFFGTRVIYGVWAFDAENRLIGVWIYRERDVL